MVIFYKDNNTDEISYDKEAFKKIYEKYPSILGS